MQRPSADIDWIGDYGGVIFQRISGDAADESAQECHERQSRRDLSEGFAEPFDRDRSKGVDPPIAGPLGGLSRLAQALGRLKLGQQPIKFVGNIHAVGSPWCPPAVW